MLFHANHFLINRLVNGMVKILVCIVRLAKSMLRILGCPGVSSKKVPYKAGGFPGGTCRFAGVMVSAVGSRKSRWVPGGCGGFPEVAVGSRRSQWVPGGCGGFPGAAVGFWGSWWVSGGCGGFPGVVVGSRGSWWVLGGLDDSRRSGWVPGGQGGIPGA